MSEEEKVTTGSETLRKAQSPRIKIWPVVLAVIFVALIAFFVAFLHWHEEPTFCSTMCHANMQKYVDGYYSEDDSLLVAKHAEADVTCLGCHWSQAKMMDLVHEVITFVSDSYTDPLENHTEFVSDEFCGGCHDGTTAGTKESATADWVIDPHNMPTDVEAHQGLNITCGDCHSVHKTSTMVCAECHDGMVTVPDGWKTPEVSVNVMANHTASVSEDQCVTCHNDTVAPSKETAVASYDYSLDFHNMDADLQSMHEGFVGGDVCQACHAENSVATCAACHADVFTELPEGWTAEAAETEEATDEAAAASDAPLNPGTYTGSSKGISSDVTVTITVDDSGAITDVVVDSSGETAGIGAAAQDELASQLLAAGSSAIDGVSGASVTSTAAEKAMDDAIAQAQA